MYMASEQTNRKPLKGWEALGAPPSLAGQRKPLLSPHLTETHQIPDGTIELSSGCSQVCYLWKVQNWKFPPFQYFPKWVTENPIWRLPKVSHSTMEPSELPLPPPDTVACLSWTLQRSEFLIQNVFQRKLVSRTLRWTEGQNAGEGTE